MKVKENLELIQQNQNRIQDILKLPLSHERSRLFEEQYKVNKSLLAENNDCINLQIQLINFLDKYNGCQLLEPDAVLIKHGACKKTEDLFRLTIEGKMPINQFHPLNHDSDFMKRLLDHYLQVEDYEKCTDIQILLSNID